MNYIQSKDEFLGEAVRVETSRYERVHGKKPKGFGQWAFYFDNMGGDPMFVPKAMNYSDAVKWAKGEAKKAGKREVYVGESLNEGKYDKMVDKGEGHVHFIVRNEKMADKLADRIEGEGLGDCDFYPEDGKIYLRVSLTGQEHKVNDNLPKIEKIVGMKAKSGSPEIWAADESVSEKRSTPYGELMLDIDAAMKKAIKNGVTTLRYAQDYVKSLERMAKKNAKRFFKDYGDFTEEDWIEDVRYNMANENVQDAAFNLDKIFGDDQESIEIFQDIEDNGTWKDMVNYIEEFGNEEMLKRYGIRSTSQVTKLAKHLMRESVNEGRAAADRLLKDVANGNTTSIEGIKMSKEMAQVYLEWLRMSAYGKKFGKGLPFNMLFPASFNWGIERYGKGKAFKDELKTLKAKAKEMKESLTEGKGDKAVSMAQKKLDKVMSDLKANLLKFKGAKTDKDKETFKSEAARLTQLRKDAQAELDNAIQSAYADAELVIMENYDTEQRKEMAAKGLALPDGSFPIKTVEDLKNAIQAYGRAKDQAAAAKFIAKRAKALNAEDLIPDTADFQKALKEAEFGRIPKFGE